MASDPPSDLDRLLDEASAAADPGPCPDENVLSALAGGGLDERERTAAVRHLVGCEACRDVVRALISHVEVAAAPGRLLVFPRWLAAAAVLLLAVGAWFVLAKRGRDSGDGPEGSGAALEVAAALLAREAPAEFGDFRPLGPADLRVRRGEPLRGAVLEASPSGRIPDPRPTLRWSAVPGARAYVVTLLGPDGVLWKRTTSDTTLPWPDGAAFPLSAGSRAVWTLTSDDPHATELERSIRVLDDGEVSLWRRAESAAASVDAPLRWLLLAHVALRRDLPGEAAAYAHRYHEARPDDPLGSETLAAATDRLSAR